MIDHLARPFIQQKFVDEVARYTARLGIRANQITVLSGVFGVLVLPALVFQQPWLAVCLMWLSGYLDMVDGSVARMSAPSHIGAVLDITTDRLVEAVIVIALYLVDPSRALVCLLMLASILLCVTSFLVVGIFSQNQSNKSFHYSPGLMERAEAFIFFTLMMLFQQHFTWLGILFSTLVLYTAIVRVIQFMANNQDG